MNGTSRLGSTSPTKRFFVLLPVLVAGFVFEAKAAIYIAPTSISANVDSGLFGTLNSPDVLIADAPGGGGVDYAPPYAVAGGFGTSWFTSASGATPVVLSFDFSPTSSTINQLYVWDYYGYSPTEWNLKLFSGAGGSGSLLLDHDFTIRDGIFEHTFQDRWIINFADESGFLSGTLSTRNSSVEYGVGLSEFGFSSGSPTPEPSTFVLGMLGLLGLGVVARRQKNRLGLNASAA
jgi:MYXO-CTERM domain-containing protein